MRLFRRTRATGRCILRGLCLGAVLAAPLPGSAQVVFTEVGDAAGVRRVHDPWGAFDQGGNPFQNHSGPGAAFVDVNRDGWLDLVLANGKDPGHYFFLNNGDGTFDDVSESMGVRVGNVGNGVITTDMNNDGYADFVFGNHFEEPDFLAGRLFKHENRANTSRMKELFYPAGSEPPGWTGPRTTGHAAGDYNNDGLLDLYLVNQITAPDLLVRNDGGSFVATDLIVPTGPGTGFQPMFFDFDDDGDQDIFVVNDVTFDFLFRNEGAENNWAFTEIARAVRIAGGGQFLENKVMGMGVAIADFDNDLDQDVYITNYRLNTLYENPGDWATNPRTFFREVAAAKGVDYDWNAWSADFFDADNDGDLDLFMVGGWVEGGITPQSDFIPNKLWLNNGAPDYDFTDVTESAGVGDTQVGRSSTTGDYDRDGDLDLFVTNNTYHDSFDPSIQLFEGFSLLYRNDTPRTHHWLNVRLQGGGDHGGGVGCNRDAVGAKLYVTTGDLTQMRVVQGGSGYQGMNSLELEFGLGDAAIVDELRVVWPCGTEHVYVDVVASRFLHLCEAPADLRAAPLALADLSAYSVRDGIRVEWSTGAPGLYQEPRLFRRGPGQNGFTPLDLPITWEETRGIGVDTTAEPGVAYEYRVVLRDDLGNRSFSAPLSATFLPTDDPLPSRPVLGQNFPNPFNPTTTILMTVPRSMQVTLRIHDARGRLVRTLFSGVPAEPGEIPVEWDGRDDEGRSVGSGVFYYTLVTEEGSQSRKLTMIR